jgi:hypothetical protein
MIGELRLLLEGEVHPGNQHTPKHSAPDLWALLDRLGPGRQPFLLRGDNAWGAEPVMREAEQHRPRYQLGNGGGAMATRRPRRGRPVH